MWQYFQPPSPAMNWCPMSLRALLYRRPSEPSVLQVVFDKAIYLVRLRRHRQARRYTLRIDAASREVVLTMPPRGNLMEAREFAQKHGAWIAARLKRLPKAFQLKLQKKKLASAEILEKLPLLPLTRTMQKILMTRYLLKN